METENLKKYVESSNQKLLNAVEGKGILALGKTKIEALEARSKNFTEKSLHSQCMRKKDEARSQETRNMIKTGTLKKEIEEMLTAA